MKHLGAISLSLFVAPFATTCASLAADMPVKAPPPATVVTEAWTVTFASEARYYAWESDRGSPALVENVNTGRGSGSQWYIPVALQLAGKPSRDFKVQMIVRSGWVHSRQSTAGLTGTVDTFTDTVLSGTVTYLGFNGIQPFISLNVNAPTGRSVLSGAAAFARMDSDLVEIGSFGEGWNVGPTVGASIPITASMILTGSVGYTWRDRFNRERSSAEPDPTNQATTSLNPADVVTGTLGLGYQDDARAWSVTGTVSEEGTTTENGKELYKAGRRYLVTAMISRNWPDQWGQTSVTASYAHSNRNEVLFLGLPPPVTETLNTNSDLHRVGVQHLFPVGDTFAFGPTASYLHRNRNSYNSTTLQFVPAKERWAAGGQARKLVAQNVTLNVRGEYVWTHEDERPAQNFSAILNQAVAGSAVPIVSSTGWMVAGGANVNF